MVTVVTREACSRRASSCRALGGGRQLESGKIGMPQADLQPSAPSPLALRTLPRLASRRARPMGGHGWQGGGGRATWGHGFVDGIRSPLHAISCGPQRALSQCSSSALPRSARKPVTCPVPQLGPPAASSSAGPALHSSCCIARPFPPYP